LRGFMGLKRDFLAGSLLILIGSATVLQGVTYHLGTLMQMGPGFMPVALGVILVLIGIVIAVTAIADGEFAVPFVQRSPDWRGWSCIVAGPFLFILLGAYGGLAPATFACVFVSALGDRGTTLKKAALLAAGTTVCGIVLFVYLLEVQFPIFRWGEL
jgi:hypothetical protein